jgi:GNAT superfamily N-acetyltransferase
MSELDISAISFDSEEFKSFMDEWEADIEKIFPHYSEDDAQYGEVFSIRVEGSIAGLFIYQYKGEELHVSVDFVIPKFRNKGIGKKLFEDKFDEFKEQGFKSIVTLTDNNLHAAYLASCGFELQAKHPDWFELKLT